MRIFRTCRIAETPALRFIKRAKDISSVVQLLGASDMIDDIFKRPLPIDKRFESRFAPAGFMKNVLYASEKKDTTYYEYGYHLLKAPDLINKPIYVNTYFLRLVTHNTLLDVSQAPDKDQILSRTTYTPAHSWINQQDINTLDVVQYPNVRDPQPGGINFAIFNKNSVNIIAQAPETLIMLPQPNNSLELQLVDNSKITITPLMK
ncbi:MAG: RES family NAD+ phosphorylase [Bdellovibrionaceae bacterium]|nr:RES family NAD+ phosphorylase [Pseudobdellovibrionaceae bacterium]